MKWLLQPGAGHRVNCGSWSISRLCSRQFEFMFGKGTTCKGQFANLGLSSPIVTYEIDGASR